MYLFTLSLTLKIVMNCKYILKLLAGKLKTKKVRTSQIYIYLN